MGLKWSKILKDLKVFDLKKLEVFVKVIETGSFSKAAELCHLTQPTVSGHIKQLEEYYEVPLIDRHTREVKPTPAGLLLHRYAKHILRLWEEFEREMHSYKGGQKGKLRIGGSTIPGQYILPFVLCRFNQKFPKIKINLQIADTKVVAEGVVKGELELGIIGAKVMPHQLHFEPVCNDEIILVIHKDYPHEIAQKKQITVEEIPDIPLIIREKGSGTWLTTQNTLKKLGLSPQRLNVVAELGSTEAVRQAVKAKLGASFISEIAVKEDLERGIFKKIEVKNLVIKRHFYLIYPSKKNLAPLAEIFIDFLKESSSSMEQD
ncbi:transcriptional regulator, LysR family [Thermodesulfatator indicus DSM 15286]|uniref:Transcriptional regulator, LysR family n=1 Tax=Thermodesulfatator indicus (strain DSM 15286 / JCM 11887 / CIR29812) TaxID=667014 RepID=F8A8D8_THEID|nr:selenium metabolism-associated LysR family transcriptional regulator [Thermodesulfatator indicus]AEH43942.1 transcriptional regulator, LysR family [Thermodesulfatator indicus DSM 15286]